MQPARKTKKRKLVRGPFFAISPEERRARELTLISRRAEREVKKATRDLNQLLNNLEPLNKIETVQRKYSELLADMKKLERDHAKNKKRADLLQKEADKAKSENSKTNTLKDKLEKLCRELTKENKKMKVRTKRDTASLVETVWLIATLQDENKRLEDTERQARGLVNERLDDLLLNVQDVMNSKGTSNSQNLNESLDNLYVNRL
jgi:predicted RNase H-like nuclease (RuvC/YqgF family)